MKTVVSAIVLAAVSITPAAAISRYNSQSLSCNQTQAKVRAEGAVILRYQSPRTGNPLFGRYVRNDLFCQSHEIAERSFVPTADRKSCPVFECKTDDRFDDDLFRRR